MLIASPVGFGQQVTHGVDVAVRNLESFMADLALAPTEEFVGPGNLAPTSIHVPEFEQEPFGKFQIELTMAEAQAIDADVEKIINAISAIGVKNVRRLLVESDAKPPLVANAPFVKDFVRKTKNLIDVYRREVLRQKPRVAGLAIAGGIFVGIIAIGAIVYAKTQQERGR